MYDLNREVVEQQDSINVSKFFVAILEKKFLLVAFALIMSVIAYYALQKLPNKYIATAKILIDTNDVTPVDLTRLHQFDGKVDEFVATQHEMMTSRTLINGVINELSLTDKIELNPDVDKDSFFRKIKNEFFPVNYSLDEGYINQVVYSNVIKNLEVSPVLNTKIINVSFESKSPKLAADVANVLGELFIENQLEQQLSINDKAINWLNQRREKIKSQLDFASEELSNYRKESQIVDLESNLASLSSAALQNLNDRLIEIKDNKLTLNQRIERLATYTLEDLITNEVFNNKPIILQLKQAVVDLERRFEQVSSRYGEKHPKYIETENSYESAKEQLRRNIKNEIKDLDKQYADILDKEKQVAKQISNIKEGYFSNSSKESKLSMLQGEVARLKELNDLIDSRFKELNLAGNFDSTNIRFIDRAKTPIFPKGPNRLLLVIVTFFAALIIGISVIVIYVLLENKISSKDDVEKLLNIPVVGMIPQLNKKELEKKCLDYWISSSAVFKESINSLRTSISLMSVGKSNNVILVTSAAPGEGKSTVSANLAKSLSQIGKVLLIDADLRRPSQSAIFDLDQANYGLTNILLETHEIDECIHAYRDNLHLVCAGQITNNPLELFSNINFPNLLKKFKEQYDFIVIDSAPIKPVSDSLLIGQQSDSCIFVVDSSKTSAKVAKEALTSLISNKVRVDGCVVNNVKQSFLVDSEYNYSEYLR